MLEVAVDLGRAANRIAYWLSSRRVLVVAAALFGALYVAHFAWSIEHRTYHAWTGLLIGPVLLAVTIPLVTRRARREGDQWMVRLLVIALFLKMAGALARYVVAFDVYGGSADASVYHRWGRIVSESFRNGDFDVDVRRTGGTGFIRLLTGYVYTVTGPTRLGGFLVFSLIGFWGLYFFYRAFRTALPEGNHRRYALLVFLLPSLVFWPSSIGKEAWMTFALGLSAYGAARLFTHQRFAYPILALGLWATTAVRPHIALLVGIALILGYTLRKARRPMPTAPAVKLAGLAVLAAAALMLVAGFEKRFGIETLDASSVNTVLDDTSAQTSQGGSQRSSDRARTPLHLPLASVNVLFRPLPFDAHNAQSLVASLEGTFLLALVALSWRHLVQAVRMAKNTPYVAFALLYLLMFVFAFSSFGNYGIMTRQRVQVLPFLFVLLAVPWVRRSPAPTPPVVEQSAATPV